MVEILNLFLIITIIFISLVIVQTIEDIVELIIRW